MHTHMKPQTMKIRFVLVCKTELICYLKTTGPAGWLRGSKCMPHRLDNLSSIPTTLGGRRELTPGSCPLTSHMLHGSHLPASTHMYHTHTYAQIIPNRSFIN